jgi:hypothetical protein
VQLAEAERVAAEERRRQEEETRVTNIRALVDECQEHPARAVERLAAWVERDTYRRDQVLWEMMMAATRERPFRPLD